ncbi:MAG TPA: hypothetical protein VGM54_15605 [Chthoniobacter sp.]|jgi:hypothetical protein
MSEFSESSNSKFWTFIGLPVSLLILAAAYYTKVPSARAWIDAHTPLGKQLFGRFVSGPPEPTADNQAPPADPGSQSGIPGVPPGSEIPAPPVPPPVQQPITYDLQTLAQDHSLWPRQVRIRKATEFPAVVDGKKVGSLVAPSGTEVNLLAIREGKLGLEYKGGGAWLPVEDTDLGTRVPLR